MKRWTMGMDTGDGLIEAEINQDQEMTITSPGGTIKLDLKDFRIISTWADYIKEKKLG